MSEPVGEKLDFCRSDGFGKGSLRELPSGSANPFKIQPARFVKSPKRTNLSDHTCRLSGVRAQVWAVLLICIALTAGCSSKRLVVRTQPEGAFVTVDGYPVGYSPVATSYVYGGSRDILIEKDGFDPVRQKVDLTNPWFLRPPVSFFTENFSPIEIRHQPVLDFQLQPKSRINGEVLLQRANTLRGNVQRGTVTAPAR